MHDAAATPSTARPVRERLSVALMALPLGVLLGFLLLDPSVWSTRLTTFFDAEGEVVRSDPGWIIALLALAAAVGAAWIGILGLQEQWQHHRRFQRGLLGSAAAALTVLLLTTRQLTLAVEAQQTEPEIGLAMFWFLCACLYGVLCLAVTPPDRGEGDRPDEALGDARL